MKRGAKALLVRSNRDISVQVEGRELSGREDRIYTPDRGVRKLLGSEAVKQLAR